MRDVNVSSAAALCRWGVVAGHRDAIEYQGATMTYAEVLRDVRRLAETLTRGGVRRGDRVAYLGLNSALLIESALAAAYIGAIFTPINYRLASDEMRHQIDHAGVHTLIVEDEYRSVIDEMAAAIPVRRFLLDPGPAAAPPRARQPDERWQRLDEVLAEPSGREPVRLTESDAALLLYTSGTTGRPKGAVLTHGNLWWNHLNTATALETSLRAPTLVVAPMFHIAGISGFTLGTLAHGGTIHIRRRFDPVGCVDDIARHRVANIIAVPAMFSAIAETEAFGTADLTSLRAVIVGGAPVPRSLVERYAARGVVMQQAWGLTETAPLATYLPRHLVEIQPDSAGVAMPYSEIRLNDPATGDVVTAANQPGEVSVRGPNVSPGYWCDPESTAAAFDDAGWFRTGDIGYFDEDGLLYIVDRLNDVIISGGENIYPAEIERVISSHARIRENAVVGVPHPRWGETPVAVVCSDGSPQPSLEQVRDHVAGHLARFKLPTYVLHRDALPRTGSGKVDKKLLRTWARDQLGI